jgi:hypothetical protein
MTGMQQSEISGVRITITRDKPADRCQFLAAIAASDARNFLSEFEVCRLALAYLAHVLMGDACQPVWRRVYSSQLAQCPVTGQVPIRHSTSAIRLKSEVTYLTGADYSSR